LHSSWGGLNFHSKLIVNRDTVFKGKKCKILSSKGSYSYEYLPFKNMICTDSSVVTFWSQAKNDFQVLYDFEAKKGDE
jgi:hypothetical protein